MKVDLQNKPVVTAPVEECRAHFDAGGVCLWFLDLTRLDLRPILSKQEAHRAAQFKFAKDQLHYKNACTLVRQILTSTLYCSFEGIDLCREKYGKPFVKGEDISFNLSKSNGNGVLAVCREGNIGVDIESQDQDFDYGSITEDHFSFCEKVILRSTSEAAQRQMFYRFWTAKEALSKAMGKGLQADFRKLEYYLDKLGNISHYTDDKKPQPSWNVVEFSFGIAVGSFVTDKANSLIKTFDTAGLFQFPVAERGAA